MDNDIRVVTDKEVFLAVAPALSKSETETALREWLCTSASLQPEAADAVMIVSVEDVLLPMSVTSVESWGNWSLQQGSFQRREFERDQRQYERDYVVYQAEEKKQQAARERGESYPVPTLPRSPNREDYFEYVPENGEYTTSFKGILRAFGEEALGKAKPHLNEVAVALDHLLRSRFPRAEAAATAPGAVDRDVLNTLVDEYVSDRGIDWVKDHASGYEKVRKIEISGVNYRRECNIVFLPARIIEYAYKGKTYVAVADAIRNEYIVGTPPVVAVAPAVPLPAAVPAKGNFGMIAGGGAAAAVVIILGAFFLLHGGKHAAPPAVTAPVNASNNSSAAAATAAQQAAQQAAQLAAAEAAQKAAQQEAAKIAAQAAQQQAAQQAAIAQAAKQAAAAQAAQDAAAVQAAQEAAAAQAAEQAATQHAALLAAQAQAQQNAAAQKAAQLAAAQAAQDAATKQAAAEAAAQAAAQQAAAAQAAQQQAQQAAAAQAAEEEAVAQAAAAVENGKAAKLAAKAKPAAVPVGKTVSSPPAAQETVAANAVPAPSGDNLTADANASPGLPPSAAPAPVATANRVVAPAAPPAPAPVPAAPGAALSGKEYEQFTSGQLRLPTGSAAGDNAAQVSTSLSTAAQTHNAQDLAKTITHSAEGNDIGYYYLGVAAQDAGNTSAARTYYQLSLQHSETNNPPSLCSPSHRATYQPELCHGIVLPSRAARALASLPGG
jgi:hypothetical protein